MSTDHPLPEILRMYLNNGLDPEVLIRVTDHIQTCEICHGVLDHLTGEKPLLSEEDEGTPGQDGWNSPSLASHGLSRHRVGGRFIGHDPDRDEGRLQG